MIDEIEGAQLRHEQHVRSTAYSARSTPPWELSDAQEEALDRVAEWEKHND